MREFRLAALIAAHRYRHEHRLWREAKQPAQEIGEPIREQRCWAITRRLSFHFPGSNRDHR